MEESDRRLERIKLTGHVDRSQVSRLVLALSKVKELKHLSLDSVLSGCTPGADLNQSLRSIIGALCGGRASLKIETLKLGENRIDCEGAKIISQAFRWQTLQVMDLRNNNIWQDGAQAIAAALSVNRTVRELHLQGNSIRDRGAEYLAEALACNSSLQHLDVSCNFIFDDGAKALVTGLASNQSLRVIKLSGNQTGLRTKHAFLRLLQSNKSLLTVDLGSEQNCGLAWQDENQIVPSNASSTLEGEYTVTLNNLLQELVKRNQIRREMDDVSKRFEASESHKLQASQQLASVSKSTEIPLKVATEKCEELSQALEKLKAENSRLSTQLDESKRAIILNDQEAQRMSLEKVALEKKRLVTEKTISRVHSHIEKLEHVNANLKARLLDKKSEETKVGGYLANIQKEVENLKSRLEQAQTTAKRAKDSAAQLSVDMDNMIQEIAKHDKSQAHIQSQLGFLQQEEQELLEDVAKASEAADMHVGHQQEMRRKYDTVQASHQSAVQVSQELSCLLKEQQAKNSSLKNKLNSQNDKQMEAMVKVMQTKLVEITTERDTHREQVDRLKQALEDAFVTIRKQTATIENLQKQQAQPKTIHEHENQSEHDLELESKDTEHAEPVPSSQLHEQTSSSPSVKTDPVAESQGGMRSKAGLQDIVSSTSTSTSTKKKTNPPTATRSTLVPEAPSPLEKPNEPESSEPSSPPTNRTTSSHIADRRVADNIEMQDLEEYDDIESIDDAQESHSERDARNDPQSALRDTLPDASKTRIANNNKDDEEVGEHKHVREHDPEEEDEDEAKSEVQEKEEEEEEEEEEVAKFAAAVLTAGAMFHRKGANSMLHGQPRYVWFSDNLRTIFWSKTAEKDPKAKSIPAWTVMKISFPEISEESTQRQVDKSYLNKWSKWAKSAVRLSGQKFQFHLENRDFRENFSITTEDESVASDWTKALSWFLKERAKAAGKSSEGLGSKTLSPRSSSTSITETEDQQEHHQSGRDKAEGLGSKTTSPRSSTSVSGKEAPKKKRETHHGRNKATTAASPKDATPSFLERVRLAIVSEVEDSGEDATFRTIREAVCESMRVTLDSEAWKQWFRSEIEKVLEEEEDKEGDDDDQSSFTSRSNYSQEKQEHRTSEARSPVTSIASTSSQNSRTSQFSAVSSASGGRHSRRSRSRSRSTASSPSKSFASNRSSVSSRSSGSTRRSGRSQANAKSTSRSRPRSSSSSASVSSASSSSSSSRSASRSSARSYTDEESNHDYQNSDDESANSSRDQSSVASSKRSFSSASRKSVSSTSSRDSQNSSQHGRRHGGKKALPLSPSTGSRSDSQIDEEEDDYDMNERSHKSLNNKKLQSAPKVDKNAWTMEEF